MEERRLIPTVLPRLLSPAQTNNNNPSESVDDGDYDELPREAMLDGNEEEASATATDENSSPSKSRKPRKKNVSRTNEFWYNLIKLKEHNEDLAVREMTVTKFLKSDLSGPDITGTPSEQQQFTRRMRLFREGKLPGGPTDASADVKRNRKGKYCHVEHKLQQFLQVKSELYKQERCGLSWNEIQAKAQHYIDLEKGKALANGDMTALKEYKDFKVSPGWITNFLRRNGVNKQLKHELEIKLNDLETKAYEKTDYEEEIKNGDLPMAPPTKQELEQPKVEVKQLEHAHECIAMLREFCHNYCYDVVMSEDLRLLDILEMKLKRSQGKRHKRKIVGYKRKRDSSVCIKEEINGEYDTTFMQSVSPKKRGRPPSSTNNTPEQDPNDEGDDIEYNSGDENQDESIPGESHVSI